MSFQGNTRARQNIGATHTPSMLTVTVHGQKRIVQTHIKAADAIQITLAEVRSDGLTPKAMNPMITANMIAVKTSPVTRGGNTNCFRLRRKLLVNAGERKAAARPTAIATASIVPRVMTLVGQNCRTISTLLSTRHKLA